MLTKLFMNSFNNGAAVVNISSSRDRMSQPQSESYTAAKGGIAALYTMEYDLLDRCLKREGRLRLLNRRRTEAGGLRPWLFIVRREG